MTDATKRHDYNDCPVCEFHTAQGDRVEVSTDFAGRAVRHYVTVDPETKGAP